MHITQYHDMSRNPNLFYRIPSLKKITGYKYRNKSVGNEYCNHYDNHNSHPHSPDINTFTASLLLICRKKMVKEK